MELVARLALWDRTIDSYSRRRGGSVFDKYAPCLGIIKDERRCFWEVDITAISVLNCGEDLLKILDRIPEFLFLHHSIFHVLLVRYYVLCQQFRFSSTIHTEECQKLPVNIFVINNANNNIISPNKCVITIAIIADPQYTQTHNTYLLKFPTRNIIIKPNDLTTYLLPK